MPDNEQQTPEQQMQEKLKRLEELANRFNSVDPRYATASGARSADWDVGYKRGQELFKEGSLGRLGENEDIKRVMEMRRQQVGGFSPQEQAAMRAQLMSQIGSSNQAAMRQLRGVQGASGIQGAAAGAQAVDVLRGGQQAMLGAERDIQMQNLLAKRQGLNELEASAMGVGRFDIGQANKEKMGAIYGGISEQMLGAADRGAARAADAANAAAAAQSGGKVLCTHFFMIGKLPHDVWSGDMAYATGVHPLIVRGYHSWAVPAVNAMKRGGIFGRALEVVAWPLVNAWATEMAFVTGFVKRGSVLGRCLRLVFEPVNYAIGAVSNKERANG